ncbi:MAG: hypothetical protein RBR59_04200 [Sulfurimonadaceae bacterium]|jgi:hypothetical protein|nr:hypothetical protein [Sulfurimonadaceae bacterium]
MRSRDGNHPFTRAICATLIFAFTSLGAEQYLISYRYAAKDAILYNEAFHVSHAMTPCGTRANEMLVLPSKDNQNLRKILLENFELFFEYIQKLGLHVNHQEQTQNLQSSSFTIITLRTTCFKVDFNDSFVIIQALE